MTVTYEVDPLTPYTAELIDGTVESSLFVRLPVSLAVFDPDVHVMPPDCTTTWRGGVWDLSVFSLAAFRLISKDS